MNRTATALPPIARILRIGLFSILQAGLATAGTVIDTDADLVPDQFDNCRIRRNGPNQAPNNQVDGDLDGYGNACDGDYNNDGAINGADFRYFVPAFNTADPVVDVTGDAVVNGWDFGVLISMYNNTAGPSGLPCAGTIPCTP